MKFFILFLLSNFIITCVSHAHDAQVPASIEHFSLDQVSQHIYVIHGSQALPSPQTRGFMNNPGIIITQTGVIIVDPGSSEEIGRQLLEKIKKISHKPVIAVFNTHVHGDHWLGNHGVRTAYPAVPVYAHERMIERINEGEGQDWIKLFMDMTKKAIVGTEVVAPNIGLKGGETLKLDDVTLRIHHTGHAHTDGDIMIEVVDDKGLFFGDIVAANRVPNSDVPEDASYKGTIKAIKSMLNGPATIFIPGHGLTGGREVPESSLRFLVKLRESVTRYYKLGLTDSDMKEKVIMDLSEFQGWQNFKEIGRVISFVYQEVEQDNF